MVAFTKRPDSARRPFRSVLVTPLGIAGCAAWGSSSKHVASGLRFGYKISGK